MIRAIIPDDLAIVAKIESEIHSHPWTEQMFQDCFKPESANLGYSGFVLEEHHTITAYLIIQTILDECHILTIGVKKDYQQQGYATELLKHLLEYTKKSYQSIFLEVRESNQPAIRLYKKLGFTPIAVRKDYYSSEKNARENALIFKIMYIQK